MKKKKTLMIIVIVLLIIIGIIAFIFFKTDYLKTNQQIFWKYAVENTEIANLFNNEDIDEIKNKKASSSYTISSDLSIETESGNYKVNSITNAKNSNDSLTKVSVSKDDTDIIDFNLVKQSNLVGFKMDELANGYITLKNSNLKQLAQNVGIENTEKIPDNINWATYIDVLEMSSEDIDYIANKYVSLIAHDTNFNNYSKEEAGIKIDDELHNATGYTLTLTENESKEILSDVFYELSEDSRTLNLFTSKMKLLNLPSEYTQISEVSNKCVEIAKNIEAAEATDEEFMQITVFVEENKLIQTNIKIKDEKIIKIVYNEEGNKINIKQELISKNSTKFVLTISELFNKALNEVEEINITNEVSEDKNSMTTNFEILCDGKTKITYKSTTQICENVEDNADYENSTKIVLNDLSETQLKNLYSAVKNLLPKIYKSKKALITGENIQEEATTENNETQTEEQNVTE